MTISLEIVTSRPVVLEWRTLPMARTFVTPSSHIALSREP
jgi:hypothetical protein